MEKGLLLFYILEETNDDSEKSADLVPGRFCRGLLPDSGGQPHPCHRPHVGMPDGRGRAWTAGGYTAYPGFIDAHSHLGMFDDSIGAEGEDGNESTDPITPQLRGIDSVYAMDRGFADALAAGVTTVVTGPGSANAIAGTFCAVKTYGRIVG